MHLRCSNTLVIRWGWVPLLWIEIELRWSELSLSIYSATRPSISCIWLTINTIINSMLETPFETLQNHCCSMRRVSILLNVDLITFVEGSLNNFNMNIYTLCRRDYPKHLVQSFIRIYFTPIMKILPIDTAIEIIHSFKREQRYHMTVTNQHFSHDKHC